MKKIITKEMLFRDMTRLVDVCAIAYVMLGANDALVQAIKEGLSLTQEDIDLIKSELDSFFGDTDHEYD